MALYCDSCDFSRLHIASFLGTRRNHITVLRLAYNSRQYYVSCYSNRAHVLTHLSIDSVCVHSVLVVVLLHYFVGRWSGRHNYVHVIGP